MKSFFQSILLCALSITMAHAGTDIQNGGAGISINGQVATFYRSQVKVDPVESSYEMDALSGLIKSLDISAQAQVELSYLVTPSSYRKFYSVDPLSFDEKVLLDIKKDYSAVTGIPVEQITVFGLTDSAKQITLLFPDFFRLSSNEQISILLHESLWITGKVTDYKHMLEIDKNFQAMLDYTYDCVARYRFYKNLGELFDNSNWAVNTAINCDDKNYYRVTGKDTKFYDILETSSRVAMAKIFLASLFEDKKAIEQFNTDLLESLKKSSPGVFPASRLALKDMLEMGKRLELSQTASDLLYMMDKDNKYGNENVAIILQNFQTNTIPLDNYPDPGKFGIIFNYLGVLRFN